MIKVETAIDPQTGEQFRCVFDTQSNLPVEPIQRFLNYCHKRGLAANTVSTYAYRLVDFWRWLEYKVLDWTEIGLDELADFVNWYLLGGEVEVISQEVGEKVSKRSPRTVNQAVTAIQELYSFHALEGRIDQKRFTKLAHGRGKRGGFLRGIVKSNPQQRKRIKLKQPKAFPGCLKDEEVVRLVEACKTYRDRLILMLLRETGIRRGELLGLHLEDVENLDVNGRIRIVRRSNPNQAWAKGTEREIPILNNMKNVQQTFEAYLLEEYPPQAEQLEHGMLFVNLEGKNIGHPMSATRLNKLFDQLYSRTGIKAHPHLLRHTMATRMLQSGYLDGYVQQLLGHKSITTTKDIYSHILDQMTLETYLQSESD
ncbi:tyrosine-type recombinase/integrase [Mastigocoleus testarum]|uniref:Transposase n=1 Tax=Mastigocoleus testarum BC008 TaxID=371196 RepID=A0A0V7ZEW0_9CYAN|nr:tyrosine-type recombinase/integrase [Mastigocoleus testarum]KST63070.1 transposase [Mastigocoleus testarum BC008]KST69071.1 transposase [Mastigocoleus testarum BC008]